MVSGMHSVRAVHSYTSSKYGFLAIRALLEFLKLQIAVNCTLMGSQPITYLTDVFVAAAYGRGKHCSPFLTLLCYVPFVFQQLMDLLNPLVKQSFS